MSDTKLNSIVALANILGETPENIQIAEEKGELTGLIDKFNNGHKIFSLTELNEYGKNHQNNYIKTLLEGENIPSDLYNKIKGTALEQLERKIKRNYEFQEDYEGTEDLLEKLIASQSKQPNESKTEDLAKIKELEDRLNTFGEVMQKNEQFRNQILKHDEILNNKTSEITQKYQHKILSDKLNGLISKIPFNHGDNEFTLSLLKEGFQKSLNNNIEFGFDESDKIFAKSKETGALITDKVGSPLTLDKVIEKLVTDLKVPLREIKQGDNITSTPYNQNQAKSLEDVRKRIEEKPGMSIQEQLKAMNEVSVDKK